MARIDLVEPYALRNARKAVRESLMAHGEEVIALRMYHVDPDQDSVPRCTCFDDVYRQSAEYNCNLCYGTTFQGGIKEMSRMWAMFSTDALAEKHDKRGVWQPFAHGIHAEYSPMLMENDYIVRVAQWSSDYRPLKVWQFYDLKTMTPESLRTGQQLGQDGNDYVGQRGRGSQLPDSHPIWNAWRNGTINPDFSVPRLDGQRR
ncbi:hypothetical protein KHQ84_gp039 [Rhodococcus phage Finch]|uniref:Uncharacterized protein n=1 Tax=Rhodococcus phage Finch TaxID=2094144 RepID=A0A2P1JXB2_9CAUD|nr:hypothetical protein KHQ84_gp039 [Rhodococcus phage Finch]AVO24979.1 hypothetical protein SEA_FINCH_39 [Rhodococcus phage Finch]